jgi:alpha-beta hydrolase superfamily lysophospholipase
MKREDFWFTSRDGLDIACYGWRTEARPVGIVQISHGMGEHALRYERTARFMTNAGFHVYANDHRGHGRTARNTEMLGDFGKGGWNALVENMAELTRLALDQEGELPLFVLGHSMGSFALQQYLLDHSRLIAAAIISGSVSIDKLPLNEDDSAPSDLSAFNASFEPARTPFDWLSRDQAEVDKYVADPLCGFSVNTASLRSMSASRERLLDPGEIAKIRKDLPIYIVAGDADPINDKLESLKPLGERYRAAGIRNVTEQYYAGGRHEMLNETNRDEVLSDLLSWMRKILSAIRATG